MIEPQLIDTENILMISTIAQAKIFYKSGLTDMVKIERWLPGTDKQTGISLAAKVSKNRNSFSSEKEVYLPIINGVVAKWGYSQEKIKNALNIMKILGWKNPEFYSKTDPYPILIRTGKTTPDSKKENETVILIAPRIWEK